MQRPFNTDCDYIVISDSPPRKDTNLGQGTNPLSSYPHQKLAGFGQLPRGGRNGQGGPPLYPHPRAYPLFEPQKSETQQLYSKASTQQSRDSWLGNHANANDGVIVYSASNPESWRPLSLELQNLFESWTNLSWSPSVPPPMWAALLPPIRLTWEQSAWVHNASTNSPSQPPKAKSGSDQLDSTQSMQEHTESQETATFKVLHGMEGPEMAEVLVQEYVSDEILWYTFNKEMATHG